MTAEEPGRLSTRDSAALDWVRRLDDPEFADWDAHLAWLEEDASNAAALDRMVLLVDAAAEKGYVPAATGPAAIVLASANDNAPEPHRRGARAWWIGGIAAVAAAALAVVATTLRTDPAERVVRTDAGEHRTLSLADGTTIALNGATAIRYAGPDAREVALVDGQAWFSVHHDAKRPFAVRVGDAVVRDVGTTFDVALSPSGATVGVGEGEVAFEADGRSVRLPAGRRLVVYRGTAVVTRVDPHAVGGWRRGRLVYRGATLAEVATDLSRATGQRVVAEPGPSVFRFTGVIVLDKDERTTFDRVEAATGARAERGAGGWRLVAQPK